MNERRSDWVIAAFCIVPVLLALIVWVTYANRNVLPITVPNLGIPALSAPSLPSDRELPMGVQNFVQVIRDNLVVVVIGVTVAVVALIMLSGIWVDATQTRRREDESYDEMDSDAPWLDDAR